MCTNRSDIRFQRLEELVIALGAMEDLGFKTAIEEELMRVIGVEVRNG
jgi:hypothetical protein